MTLFSQLRLLCRHAVANPGFALVSLAMLAIGVGANVAIFAIVNAVLLRPLPLPDSERLVILRHAAPALAQLDELPMSDALYFLYAEQSRTLESVAVYRDEQASFTGPENPQRVAASSVTASFFDVMRTTPRLGRPFTAEEDRAGAAPVTVLSDGLWRTRFGADPGVIGRVVDLDGASVEVVGVMPPGFAFSQQEVELWRPIRLDRDNVQLGSFGINGVARLADEAPLGEAQAELDAMLSNLAEVFPDEAAAPILASAGFRPQVDLAREVVVGDIEAMLWILLGAVGFLLLIACANVANLFLVRSEARHGEVAIRAALGESRGWLVATILFESLALGVAGGLLALPLALAAVRLLVRFGPQELPRLNEISIDAAVVLFGLAVSVLAGLLFGLLPALRASAVAGGDHMTARARGATVGRERQLARRGLVVVQIALRADPARGVRSGGALVPEAGGGRSGLRSGRRPDVRAGAFRARLRDGGRAAQLPPGDGRPPGRSSRRRRCIGGLDRAAGRRGVRFGAQHRGPPAGRRRGAAGFHDQARSARLLRHAAHRAGRGARFRSAGRRAGGFCRHRVTFVGAHALAGRECAGQGDPAGRPAGRRRPGVVARRWRGGRRPRDRAAREPAGDGVLPASGHHRWRGRARGDVLRRAGAERGGAGGRGARDGARTRPRAAARGGRDPGDAGRAGARRAGVRDDPAHGRRRTGAPARLGRPLRRGLLHGDAAPARDRHPHGGWRAGDRRAPPGADRSGRARAARRGARGGLRRRC